MRQDDISINKVIQEAGLLSRAAARTKALGGAIKQGAADVATAVTGKKPAPDAGWRGKYTQGKQEQILKTLSNDIIKDLTKLKLVPTGSPLNPTDLQKTLNQYISKYTGVGATQQPQSQTAPQTTSEPTPEPASTPTPQTQPAAIPQTQTAPQASTTTPTQIQTPSTPQTQTSETETTTEPEPEAPEAPSVSIPLGSMISDKNGKSYRYTSPDEIGETTSKGNIANPMDGQTSENAKWYELSKSGKSAYEIDNQDYQSAISSAWEKKNATEQQQKKQAETPTFESFKKYFWK
jgi:hypothetical protein